jgi:hypothetical protein
MQDLQGNYDLLNILTLLSSMMIGFLNPFHQVKFLSFPNKVTKLDTSIISKFINLQNQFLIC